MATAELQCRLQTKTKPEKKNGEKLQRNHTFPSMQVLLLLPVCVFIKNSKYQVKPWTMNSAVASETDEPVIWTPSVNEKVQQAKKYSTHYPNLTNQDRTIFMS